MPRWLDNFISLTPLLVYVLFNPLSLDFLVLVIKLLFLLQYAEWDKFIFYVNFTHILIFHLTYLLIKIKL